MNRVRWLNAFRFAELSKRTISRKLVDAIIGKKLEMEKHLPLIQSAQNFSQQIVRLNEGFLKEKAVVWISGDVNGVELESKLALLIQATGTVSTQALEWAFDDRLNILEIVPAQL